MGVLDGFRRNKIEHIEIKFTDEKKDFDKEKWKVGDKISLDYSNIYEIIDIKEGGMGVVYIACPSTKNEEWYAIKTFKDEFLTRGDIIDSFVREAKTWIKLGKHENIVRAEAVLKIAGRPYLLLEYVDGGSLRDWILNGKLISNGRVNVLKVLKFAIQFCDGMIYAHNKLGIVHRDISPENILITKDEVFKITDWGLVKALDEIEKKRGFIGKPAYAPPEQFLDVSNCDIRSDIYSFGVVFHEMLTGVRPFKNVKISGELGSIVMKCIKRYPEERYQNFTELRNSLAKYMLQISKL